MKRLVLLLAALASAFVVSTPQASAQEWLTDRARAQGPGFRVGNLELHPGIGVEGGYDSNVFYEDANADGGGLLRITAHLLLSTLTEQRETEGEGEADEGGPDLQFTAGVAASYYHFFNRGNDNVSVDGNFNLTFNPSGLFTFRIYDTLGRRIRPFADTTPDGPVNTHYGRVRNTGGVEFGLQSRGRTLSAMVGYHLDLDFFEGGEFQYLNNLNHVVDATVNWRFFPNTALVSHTDVQFQGYFSAPSGLVTARTTDNVRVNSWLGLNGSITPTLAFTAMVGYSAGFYDELDDYDDILAHLGLNWSPQANLKFSLGYRRSTAPSFIGSFVRSDRLYLKGQALVGGAFLLGAEVSASFDQTGLARSGDGSGDLGNSARRSDIRMLARVFAEYRLTDYLALNASLLYSGDFTDYVFNDGGAMLPDAAAGYNKVEAWLGIRLFY